MLKQTEYWVGITERLSRIIKVEAATEEQALETVEKRYKDGIYILDSGDFLDVEFHISES